VPSRAGHIVALRFTVTESRPGAAFAPSRPELSHAATMPDTSNARSASVIRQNTRSRCTLIRHGFAARLLGIGCVSICCLPRAGLRGCGSVINVTRNNVRHPGFGRRVVEAEQPRRRGEEN